MGQALQQVADCAQKIVFPSSFRLKLTFEMLGSLNVREGFKKKNVKKYGLLPNWGAEGSARVV